MTICRNPNSGRFSHAGLLVPGAQAAGQLQAGSSRKDNCAISPVLRRACSFELALRFQAIEHFHGCSPTDRRASWSSSSRSSAKKGITPSTREIQNHFGYASQTSVMQYLGALERKGFLDRHARKARALITPGQKVRITRHSHLRPNPRGHGDAYGAKHRRPRFPRHRFCERIEKRPALLRCASGAIPWWMLTSWMATS